jgi:hypothetical protein
MLRMSPSLQGNTLSFISTLNLLIAFLGIKNSNGARNDFGLWAEDLIRFDLNIFQYKIRYRHTPKLGKHEHESKVFSVEGEGEPLSEAQLVCDMDE